MELAASGWGRLRAELPDSDAGRRVDEVFLLRGQCTGAQRCDRPRACVPRPRVFAASVVRSSGSTCNAQGLEWGAKRRPRPCSAGECMESDQRRWLDLNGKSSPLHPRKVSPNTRFEGGGGGKPRRSHCEPVAAWCSQSTWVSRLNTRPPSTPTTPHTIGTLAPHMGLPSRPTTTFTTPPTACHTIEQGLQRPRPHPRRRRRQTRARRGRRRRRARRYGSAPPAAVHALPPPQPSRVTTARSHHASRAPSADLDSPPPRQDPNAPDPKNVTQKAPKEFGNFLSGKKPVSLSLGSGATNRRRAVCQCHPPKNAR